jgi:hypothetical protein
MLPGFRFLFAAIMLSMSLLVFGLGAAALLRAAHESFASNSSWRGAPEVTFAQRNDATLPMLATLSVDGATEKANDTARFATAPTESTPSPAESASPDQLAVLGPAETPPAENATPDVAPVQMPAAQNPPAPEVAPAAPAVAVSDASSDNSESAMAQPEPTVPQPTPIVAAPAAAVPATTAEASAASTKIATLGGPPVNIAATGVPGAKDDQSAVKRRVQARRIVHRRRFAARSRLAVQQLQQQQANPFGQPAPAVATRQGP